MSYNHNLSSTYINTSSSSSSPHVEVPTVGVKNDAPIEDVEMEDDFGLATISWETNTCTSIVTIIPVIFVIY